MGIKQWILSMFPSYKWCGCKETTETSESYQFRVQGKSDGESNLFQLRAKQTCEECEEDRINVLLEADCEYEPEKGIHERKVAVDEDDMIDHGFQSQDEMARMLIEMRLSHSLEPEIAD